MNKTGMVATGTLTERGVAVAESGLTVRQAHEIETGCSAEHPCANCQRYLT